jgi:PAS domain S-box-containing protein
MLIYYYIILRYSLFPVTPARAVNEILHTTSGSIIALDVKSRISFINRSASALLGANEESICAAPLSRFFEEKDCALVSDRLLVHDQPIIDLETKAKTYDGEERLVKMNGIILKDNLGAKLGVILDLEDITESKRVAEELKRHAGELEQMNKFMVGREMTMLEIKKEVNHLLAELHRPEKYG